MSSSFFSLASCASGRGCGVAETFQRSVRMGMAAPGSGGLEGGFNRVVARRSCCARESARYALSRSQPLWIFAAEKAGRRKLYPRRKAPLTPPGFTAL